MKKHILGILIVIIGLLVLFAPFGFAHVCFPKADGGFMKCHWMGEAARMLGGLITILGAVFLFCKSAQIGIAFSNIGLGICLILLETAVIGTCKHATMPCNVYTKPVILLLAIALILVNAVSLFVNRKNLVR